MALTAIIPEATLTYNHPAAGGMVTEFGYSRDWRFSKLWQGRYVEYIEPLSAMAPAGTIYPRDMALADWTVTRNTAVGEWYSDSYPVVKGLLFRDGQVYPAETSVDVWSTTLTSNSEALPPNLVLHTIRSVAPPGQGVVPQVNVELQGVYWDGTDWDSPARLSLILPKESATYKNPLLHVYVGAWADAVNPFTDNSIVSEGPGSSSAAQGVLRESWIIETVEIWQDSAGVLYGETGEGRTFVRSHFLVRNTADMSAWWHWSSDVFRCKAAGQWRLNMGGAITWVNVVPIYYGAAAGYCWPPKELPLPVVTGSDWNEEASPWGGVQTSVSDWTVVAAATTTTPPGVSHRPTVTFTRTSAGGQFKRPVAWLAFEEHPATVAVPEGLPAEEDTTGTTLLRFVTYELNNRWKGAHGTAEFYPSETVPYPNWQENGIIELAVGLAPMDAVSNDPNLALAQVATGYILPGGIKRSRDGSVRSGGHQLSIAFGDYAASRLAQKAIVDFRQAALRTVEAWAQSVALRIGIPTSAVTVDAGVASKIIPYHELPSLANLAPQDGDSWESHIADVERACGIRVCFDYAGTGGMQVDSGPPLYSEGVSAISFALDEDSVTLEDQIEQIELDRDGGRFRNFLKLNYGPEENRTSYYYAQTTVARTAGIGDDWPEVINADAATAATDILAEFLRERYRWGTAVRWTGPLRRHLRPDQFVTIDVTGLGIAEGTVLQIISHEMSCNRETMTAQSTCLCAAVVTA
jgi:hypothetical protein